ncbi:beta-ketoacyl synthase N-terminal-like domain-containing protein [Streptomyces sp. NPDC001139]
MRLDSSAEPIAIVGMACRTAGADDVGQFWDLLRAGSRMIKPVPDGRLVGLDPGPVHVAQPQAALIDGVDRFDAAFFGISRRMAAWADPHQRFLLELAWHALEDAGIAPDRLRGEQVAVVTSSFQPDYLLRMQRSGRTDAAAFPGTMPTFGPNRISYFFDWTGPSLAVDTSCSSGLTALGLAVQGLRHGEYPLAVVGACSVISHGFWPSCAYRAGALSPTGESVPFSTFRDGYVRGEGGGCLVLKTLAAARRDGDPVHAVIRAVSIGHDGRSGGLTSTHAATQTALTRRTLAQAGLIPQDLGYLEAHGTGTGGDAIEVAAMREVLGRTEKAAGPGGRLWVGSVKSNVGHLEAAAGLLGVVKAALVLRENLIPRTAWLDHPDSTIWGADETLTCTAEEVPWPSGGTPRRIAVNSFGVGGTLAQAIVEDPPSSPGDEGRPVCRPLLFPLSAATDHALSVLAARLHDVLSREDHPLEAVAWTLQSGRNPLRKRAVLVADAPTSLLTQLRSLSDGLPVDNTTDDVALSWLAGADVDWEALWPGDARRERVRLPGYPFERRSHWFDPADLGSLKTSITTREDTDEPEHRS